MTKRYQIFLSSTYKDLQEERLEVLKAILELGCFPSSMEYFPAANEEVWEFIKNLIDECDYYILVIAGKYDSTDKEGVSYTQKEYEYALSKNIPIISFVYADFAKLPYDKVDADKIKLEKLISFRNQVQKKMCKQWSSPQELGSVVSRSLAQLIGRNPQPGWVRSKLSTSQKLTNKSSGVRSNQEKEKASLNKIDSSFLEKFHQKAIHDVRDLIVNQILGLSKDYIMSKFSSIASSYRDTMACILGVLPDELHCTVKIFVRDHDETDVSKYKVYTLVRSNDPSNYWYGRPLEFGSTHSHLAGENSSFAALLGIPDRKNSWPSNAYTCFIANSLDKSTKYDSSGTDWFKHYKSTVVFPIRYYDSHENYPSILGFLTFDAKKNIFGKKDVFDISSPVEYHRKISLLPLFHMGGVMADLLAASLIMYKAKN